MRKHSSQRLKLILVMSMFFLALTSMTATAENRSTSAYKLDEEGNVLRDAKGNCVRTRHWTEETATVVGCDGYRLDTSAQIITGQPIKGGVVTLELPNGQLFAVDDDQLNDKGRAFIDKTTDDLLMNMSGAYRIIVAGHTDSSGAEEYNIALSKRRAQSVADYLIAAKGLDPKKIRVLGMGPSQPVADNSTQAGREKNRRAEIVVVGRLRAMDKMVFPSATLFARRSAELSETGKTQLQADTQKVLENFRNATMVEVIGHTDDVGGEDYNAELSLARADTVASYLQLLGVNPEKIVRTGAGQHSPIASNATEQGRQQNRRVEILVVGRQR